MDNNDNKIISFNDEVKPEEKTSADAGNIYEIKEDKELPVGAHLLYLIVVGLSFLAFAAVFLFFPRTRYSELEKRELASFPDTKILKENPADFTSAVSQWFSDSEPYRDRFMTLSMGIRDALRYSFGNEEDMVSFRPSSSGYEQGGVEKGDNSSDPLMSGVENPLANENAKIANAGIVIVGSGPNLRALMAYGGGPTSGRPYLDLIDSYVSAFPSVKVYALIAPLATEFYLPEKASKVSKSQRAVIEYVREHLSPKARFVDAYSALAAHVNEDIYLRTDHHWAPLGGYYAAKELARVAGVPFRGLDSYDRHAIRNFVGSMYGYSKDIAVKNAPEDFVYYTPRGLDYKTTYITYNTNKDYEVVSESKPHGGPFFHKFKDGSGNAYLTFMGGDQHLVKVVTGTPGSRRLLIIKDSYGNTLPGYLFYSFSEVHVVDFRYFKYNMASYVADNHITDIVIAFNIFNAGSSSAAAKVKKFIRQPSGDFSTSRSEKDEEQRDEKNRESSAEHSETHVNEVPENVIPETETPERETPEHDPPATDPEHQERAL